MVGPVTHFWRVDDIPEDDAPIGILVAQLGQPEFIELEMFFPTTVGPRSLIELPRCIRISPPAAVVQGPETPVPAPVASAEPRTRASSAAAGGHSYEAMFADGLDPSLGDDCDEATRRWLRSFTAPSPSAVAADEPATNPATGEQ